MYLLRHGQSEFNLHYTATRRDPGIADPVLTQAGRAQARQAAAALAGAGVERIVVSPYTRALQTAREVAAVLAVPVRVELLVRERFAFACDVGTGRSGLAHDWPEHDFGTLEEVWWPNRRESEAEVIARADAFRRAMRDDPAQGRTLLVSHWGFILALTGQSVMNGGWLEWDPHAPAPAELDWS